MKKFYSPYSGLGNNLSSMLLLAGMFALLGLIGWLLAGSSGIGLFVLLGIVVFISAPRITPRFILRLHRAKLLQPEDAPMLYEIIVWLVERAGMKKVPTLYYFPSSTINAFTTGLQSDTSIAISDGMLRQLSSRELTGVLAHEISHIHNHDLLVMLMADVMSRLTSLMAFTGYFLTWIYIPLFALTDAKVPWLLLLVLILAPTLSLLMQLALSRVHEFSADTEAAKLTGDPLGLASALEKIDYYQGNWVESMLMPSRRMYHPALLRTHPLMVDRVKRLKQMAAGMSAGGHPFDSSEKRNWVPFAASRQVPRG